MTVGERVEELLSGVPAVERLRLLNVKDAARLLGLAPPTIYRLVAGGDIPHVKLGGADRRGRRGKAGAVRFRLADIVAFSVEREVRVLVADVPRGAHRIAADIKRAGEAS